VVDHFIVEQIPPELCSKLLRHRGTHTYPKASKSHVIPFQITTAFQFACCPNSLLSHSPPSSEYVEYSLRYAHSVFST
jgi:hypothetical protein